MFKILKYGNEKKSILRSPIVRQNKEKMNSKQGKRLVRGPDPEHQIVRNESAES